MAWTAEWVEDLPLVLLHGMGSGGFAWSPVVPALQATGGADRRTATDSRTTRPLLDVPATQHLLLSGMLAHPGNVSSRAAVRARTPRVRAVGPGAAEVSLLGVGHVPTSDDPTFVAEVIIDFMVGKQEALASQVGRALG